MSGKLRFAANLSMMFVAETPHILERYELARAAGFKAVECAFLYGECQADAVAAKRKSGLRQVLINSFPGNLTAGELGLAAVPHREDEFRQTLETSIDYCKVLDCDKLHIMAGKMTSDTSDRTAMERTYLENLKFAAKRLEKEGILGLIEPINNISVPNYFLNDFDDAIRYIEEVNSSKLKLQLDVFHLQHITGNLTHKIKEYFPYVGHIQVAQVPLRSEPDSPGEIRYDYVFQLLQELDYDGWIGCEYIPRGKTDDGLHWVQKYGFTF